MTLSPPKSRRVIYESMSRGDLIDALCQADRAPTAENIRLLHDLQVHQGELEMQNRQLREAQEALEESRTRYADLFDLAPVAYIVFDHNGAIEDANVIAATLLRTNRSALIGVPFTRAVGVAEKQTFADHIGRCFSEALRVTSELVVDVRGRGELTLQIISTPLLDARTGLVKSCRTMLNDVTRLKRSEQVFRFLANTSETFAASLDVEATVAAVARACVPTIADTCFVDLCDPEDETAPLRRAFIATQSRQTSDVLKQHAQDETWRKHELAMVKTLAPVFEPTGAATLGIEYEAQLGARGLLLLPLVGRTRTLGLLAAMINTSKRVYTLQDLELAQDIARRAAMALDNAFAHDTLRSAGLDVDRPAPRSEPPVSLLPASRSAPRPMVLLLSVEDEQRASLRVALESAGYAVVDSNDSGEAAKLVRTAATPPCAIVVPKTALGDEARASLAGARLIAIDDTAQADQVIADLEA